jgi:hypothetical protein
MTVALPKVRVGDPIRYQALSLFPLFSDVPSHVDYRLSPAALADHSVTVEEVSAAGSVPTLLVENKSDARVLFLEGEELIGAKQNRILNTSVLITGHSKVQIPVSCVEQQRWAYRSRYFTASESYSPSRIRRALKESVAKSLRAQRGHTSDQGRVWDIVSDLHSQHGVVSQTSAMSDAYDQHQQTIADYQERLKYVDSAIGLAVAVGDRVLAVDLFDKASTCQQVWNRLISGYVFDSLDADRATTCATTEAVEQLIDSLTACDWQVTQAVGEGEEYRAESSDGHYASALLFQDTTLHGSIVAAMPG